MKELQLNEIKKCIQSFEKSLDPNKGQPDSKTHPSHYSSSLTVVASNVLLICFSSPWQQDILEMLKFTFLLWKLNTLKDNISWV